MISKKSKIRKNKNEQSGRAFFLSCWKYECDESSYSSNFHLWKARTSSSSQLWINQASSWATSDSCALEKGKNYAHFSRNYALLGLIPAEPVSDRQNVPLSFQRLRMRPPVQNVPAYFVLWLYLLQSCHPFFHRVSKYARLNQLKQIKRSYRRLQ